MPFIPSLTLSLSLLSSPRTVAVLSLIACVFAFATVRILYEEVLELYPCWLCVLQRYCLLWVALASLITWAHKGKTYALLLGIIGSIAGIGVSGWHTYLLYFAEPSTSCAPSSWDYLVDTIGVMETIWWLSSQVTESCTEETWKLFGILSIPVQSLLLFGSLLALWVNALVRNR